jgi:hypothetical protein
MIPIPIPVHKFINKLCVEINSIAANVVKQQTRLPKVHPQSHNNKFHLASLLAFVRLTIPNIPSTLFETQSATLCHYCQIKGKLSCQAGARKISNKSDLLPLLCAGSGSRADWNSIKHSTLHS